MEWISVEKEMPTPDERILLIDEGTNCPWHIGVFSDARNLFTAIDRQILHSVTHWMPLPEPPKGE